MDEQVIGALATIVSGLINQNATLQAANKAFYASVISAGASLFVCGITVYFTNRQSIRVKQKEYVDDYYKYIVKRRIAAYELLENFVVSLKFTLIGDDDRTKPYHIIFSCEEDYHNAYKLLLEITPQALWLSRDSNNITRELNYILFKAHTAEKSMIDYGKENYKKVADLRSKLENMVAKDMLNLYDVETFLKEKKENESEFVPIALYDSPPKI